MHGAPTSSIDVPDRGPPPRVRVPAGWTLGRCLATGGTAVVYEVTHQSAPVAVLKRGKWRDREIAARFELEADALRRIGAPTTPAYLAHGTDDGFPYLIMERLAGETLATWMSRVGVQGGLGEILAILTRLARSLERVHEAGIVHRDLKPENISIGSQGVRLLDFGLAKPLRSSLGLTQIGSVVGTVHYLAPEQLRSGGIVDHRADIYAFGAVAFEMLTGQPVFAGDRRAIEYHHQVCRPPTVRETRDIPVELDQLILQCLAKQVEARPQTAAELQAALGTVGSPNTIRGIGAATSPPEPRQLGKQARVALAWVEGADPLAVARAIGEVQGIVVRSRGDGILCAFSSSQHDAPLTAALHAIRPLVRDRCRAVFHETEALIRRAAQGKVTVYGPELDRLDWVPAVPYAGVVVTSRVAELVRSREAAEVPGHFRLLDRDQTDITDARSEPTMVGRDNLLRSVLAATERPSMLVGLFGDSGIGKSRLLDALALRLRQQRREVIVLRSRRRLLGDRPDDDRLLAALGGTSTQLAQALEDVRRRHPGVVVIVDNAHCLSEAARRTLFAARGVRILASPTPLFEPLDHADDRIAFDLPPLSYDDASRLLREMLRPAQLLPDVLIERLAIRGTGNPGLLVELARDIKQRGAVRRHAGGDDWYVAADELDTLLAPPSPSWLAARALDSVPLEHAAVFRACSALGARFRADEVAAVAELADSAPRLTYLTMAGYLVEHDGHHEFATASLQDAIYQHALDDRLEVHRRALRFWLTQPAHDLVGWLAHVGHHAAGAGEAASAAAAWSALAAHADRHGGDQAEELRARVVDILLRATPLTIADAIRKLDHGADLEAESRPTQVHDSQPPRRR